MNLKRGRNQTQLDDSIEQRKVSHNPQTLNVKQSLQVLRRINRSEEHTSELQSRP